MSTSHPSIDNADIRIGEVTWSKATAGAQAVSQQKHLLQLAEDAETGLILDCGFVEVANSELLNLLVRIRTQAKKQHKGFVLFHVPENLNKTIKLCKLNSVLPISTDMNEARKLAYDLSRGTGPVTRTIKRILKM